MYTHLHTPTHTHTHTHTHVSHHPRHHVVVTHLAGQVPSRTAETRPHVDDTALVGDGGLGNGVVHSGRTVIVVLVIWEEISVPAVIDRVPSMATDAMNQLGTMGDDTSRQSDNGGVQVNESVRM